jgi:hypothetical protein
MPQLTNQHGHHFYQNGHFGQVGPFKRLWFMISCSACNQVIIDIIVPDQSVIVFKVLKDIKAQRTSSSL